MTTFFYLILSMYLGDSLKAVPCVGFLHSPLLSLLFVTESQFQLLSRYDPTDELVMDYIELYVQWGYLTLFGSAFPVSVALAAVTDFVETRTDG